VHRADTTGCGRRSDASIADRRRPVERRAGSTGRAAGPPKTVTSSSRCLTQAVYLFNLCKTDGRSVVLSAPVFSPGRPDRSPVDLVPKSREGIVRLIFPDRLDEEAVQTVPIRRIRAGSIVAHAGVASHPGRRLPVPVGPVRCAPPTKACVWRPTTKSFGFATSCLGSHHFRSSS
jgi:hypothetical protein